MSVKSQNCIARLLFIFTCNNTEFHEFVTPRLPEIPRENQRSQRSLIDNESKIFDLNIFDLKDL